MRGFRIEFVEQRRRPATWIVLAAAVVFLTWSWSRFEERSEAAKLAAAADTVATKVAPVDDPRRAQEQADARSRQEALDYPWPDIMTELEAIADDDTSVLRFEHVRSDGVTHVTIQTKNFESLERSLAQVRRIAPPSHRWTIVSTSRDTADALHPLRAELSAKTTEAASSSVK
jgi:hypothetical protein